mmetsp:Transcript_27260/g.84034  ORF Transcript_27260/g.84034 Transcript_27260/m.84034 type:complete len:94 (-) Transcript_27260:45-326(-)
MPPHQDTLNQGLCLAVGNYSGGELVIDEPSGRKMHNIKGRLLRYNGHQASQPNPSTDSSGKPAERFSFVLYTRKKQTPKPSQPITPVHLQYLE